MKLFKLISVFAFLLLLTMQLFSQNKVVADNSNSILVDDKKPAVYLEFVKTGICNNGNYFTTISVSPCEKKSDLDEQFEAVWVRFVNNTRWAIMLDVQKASVPPAINPMDLSNKRTVSAAKDGAELDIIYDIESETGCDFHVEVPKGEPCKRRETTVPSYYRRGFSGNVFVPSNQSVIFAVNQAHLKKYLTTYVLYNYEWEISKSGQPSLPRYDSQHRIYFSWFDLETGLKKESDKRAK